MATVAELLVKIGGDSSGLRKEIQASERQIKRAYGPEALAASEKFAVGLGVITAAASAAAVAAGKMAVEWNLAVNELGDITGMSGEAGSKILATAQLVGVSGEEMSAALVKMSKSAEAAFESIKENGANSTDAYTKFGIAIMDSNGEMLSAEQIYTNVAAKHREMADGVQKTAMELAIFGKKGAALNDLLNMSEQQMADLTARAEKMGLIIGTEQAAAWENATFEVNRAKIGFTAAGNAIMTTLLPAVSSGTSAVADMLEAFAVDTKMDGIATALKNLIPDSLEPAIMGVSVALTAYAIPALTMTGYKAMLALGPLGWFGIALGTVAGLAVETGNALAKMGDQADDAVARLNGFNPVNIEGAPKDITEIAEQLRGLGRGTRSAASSYSPLDTATKGVGASGTGTKGAQKVWDDLVKDAEQAHKSIEREWVQLTNTQIQQLNKWREDELKELDKSASANEHYLEDKQRLEEIYAAKKKKIDENEYSRVVSLKRDAQDAMTENKTQSAGMGLTGVKKQAVDLQTGMESQILAVTRKYEDMTANFATLDDDAKANNIKAWQEAGLAFKINEDGTVDFTEQVEARKLTIRQNYDEQYRQLEVRRVGFQEDLEQAHHDGNIARFTALLQEKQALEAQDLAGRQQYLDAYYTIWQEAHRSTMSYMAESMMGVYNNFTTFFADILSNTKNVGDAWSALGKSMIQMIANMAAQWIASRLAMAIFGKTTMAGEIATSAVAGAAMAAAWAPAAAMVSLATFGANSGPAMAGIAATVGLSTALSLPQLANGGITTGPTLAMIGDNKRYDEVVMPLSRRVFEKAGLVGKAGTVTVNQHNYGDIHTDADLDAVNIRLGRSLESALAGGLA